MSSIFDIIPRRLEGTSLQAPLSGLHRIYEHIETSQQEWIAASPYRCPEGCGSCCEGFEPDILDVEALYLAAWILRKDPSRIAVINTNAGRGGCVLAKSEGPYHCTVYGGRPLICRLFAFSGDRAKDGSVRYRACSRMKVEGERQLGEEGLQEQFGLLPPAMGDLATEAALLFPGSSSERRQLRDALPEAIAKIRYLTDLSTFALFAQGSSDWDGDNDNDNPDGSTPPLDRAM